MAASWTMRLTADAAGDIVGEDRNRGFKAVAEGNAPVDQVRSVAVTVTDLAGAARPGREGSD